MRLTPSKYRRNVVGQILPAFSAASGASLCAYPLDTIRRNVMLRKDREGKVRIHGDEDADDMHMYVSVTAD